MSLNCIFIKEINVPNSRVLCIVSGILKSSLIRNLFEKCTNWGSKTTNIDTVQTSFPEYIWIVNNQQLAINKKNLNNFKVNQTLILGGDRMRVYNLKGIVFKVNYK